MKYSPALILSLLFFWMMQSCNQPQQSSEQNSEKMSTTPVIKEETVNYQADTATMKSFIVYDSSSDKKRPVVLVIPEWWGLTDYVMSRARQLASMGYVAMAVDIYGGGSIAENPEEAKKMSEPFYASPELAKSRFDAALVNIKSNRFADTGRVAVIGYCFGGGLALNMARLGENLAGVVSFHGSLIGVPPRKELLKAPILICHGEADKFIPEADIALFKKQMDSINAQYTFKSYPGATHAFTNPKATETGKKFSMPIEYNAAADTASWNDMKVFFGKIFQ